MTPWRRQTLRLRQGWVMSEHQPLFTYDEWQAMSDAERAQWRDLRRMAVEQAQRDHQARRQRLNDSLTVERFGHDDG